MSDVPEPENVYRYLAGYCPKCQRILPFKRLPKDYIPEFHPEISFEVQCPKCGPVNLLVTDLFQYQTERPLHELDPSDQKLGPLDQ